MTTCIFVGSRIAVGLRKSKLPAGCASQASASPIAACTTAPDQLEALLAAGTGSAPLTD